MTVQTVKLTLGKLRELDDSYKQELQVKVKAMSNQGYKFLLCWNFSAKVLDKWEYAKNNNCPYTTQAVRGIFQKEEFEGVILVALNKGSFTVDSRGRTYPTEHAKTAFERLGITPVKSTFKATLHNDVLVDYKFADPSEVVAFL